VLKLGQEVLHDGLQLLIFDVVDIHRLNFKIGEKLSSISSVLSFETNTSLHPEFLYIYILAEQVT
jgi:hypothetical protein